MRLPNTEFTERPWRIHELAKDFVVEDVWRLPTPGGPDDLDRLARQFTDDGKDFEPGLIYRFLFEVRWKLGAVLRLDKPDSGVGERVGSLRERLPDDLREGERGPDFRTVPFTSVYQTQDEWVSEMANKTVQCLMHIGWVEDANDPGRYHAQMTVLVKPNGLLGKAYQLGVDPFRRILVVPALLGAIGKQWRKADVSA